MTGSDLLSKINRNLLNERAAFVQRERSHEAGKLQAAQTDLLQTAKEVGRSGDLELIMATERTILINELRLYGNSAGMKSSLSTAIEDIKQAERHVPIVKDKKRYAAHAELFQRPKNRRGGLPYDEARQFFNAHNTRLLNQDRSRLSDVEKRTLNVRRTNIRNAEKMYAALQVQALGIGQSHDKGRDRGISR
ncbi:MAG: hypothetical protein HQL35_09140 [Alphaproteobacteria bacterium]|nr:hypothetical protein [Alphaproteobacteria bacterium]